MLRDATILGEKRAAVERYLDALVGVAIEAMAPGGSQSSTPMGRGRKESTMPNFHPGWASDLIDLELDELTRRAERLELWIEHPKEVKRRRKSQRRCTSCGRGVGNRASFCSSCGATLDQ